MTVFSWSFLIVFFGVVGWLWSFLFRVEKPVFRCVGCGKCAAAGECVLMKEERERKLALEKKREIRKKAVLERENPQEPS